mmetsp:Transcript_35381/g.64364  ORF Transcript_35381/g.64364 Transcript_35381/m.64364 type:complete len:201 (+) Transcript_35381:630-1232(+)
MPGYFTGWLPVYMVSPIAKTPGLFRPIISPGYAVSTVSRSEANSACAADRLTFFLVREWVTFIPFSNFPLHTRTYARRSRCLGSRLACSLNTKPVNSGWVGASGPAAVVRAGGAWPSVRNRRRNTSTPKLVMADPKNIGLCSPASTRAMSSGSNNPSSISTSSMSWSNSWSSPRIPRSPGSSSRTVVSSAFFPRWPFSNR